MTPTLADKEAFFSQLDELDSVSDGSPESPDDFDRVPQSALDLRRVSTPPVSSPSPFKPASPVPLLPTPRASPEGHREPEVPCTHDISSPRGKRRPNTDTMKRSTKPDAPGGSRKRKICARTIPEQQQIFKGLVFCEFPDPMVRSMSDVREIFSRTVTCRLYDGCASNGRRSMGRYGPRTGGITSPM